MQCGRLLTKCVESQSQPNLTSPWKEGCNPYLGTVLNPHLVATLGPWTMNLGKKVILFYAHLSLAHHQAITWVCPSSQDARYE